MQNNDIEDNNPFFILGAPRSGTTLLRDILKSHDRLCSPEETFYFRWPFPYGTKEYRTTQLNNPTIRMHREMDGMEEAAFTEVLEKAASRKEIMDYHGAFVVEQTGKARWFDKTPQNVYGAFLMAAFYPDSKFICIWRHPLNVAASLMEGRQIKTDTIQGAVNYWMEAALIILQFQKLHADRLLTLRYEDLVESPEAVAGALLEDLGEEPRRADYAWGSVHAEKNLYEDALNQQQVDFVLAQTAEIRTLIGY